LKLQAFGHRGAAGHAPENTLASVQKALDLGVDWIEIDVQRVENALVVIHDSRLERTTNGKGRVDTQSLDAIRALDAGAGEHVPLLEEVFDRINRRCGINIELKGPETAIRTAEIALDYISRSHWQANQILISSFNLEQLAEVRRYSEQLQLAPLYKWPGYPFIKQAVELKAAAVHIHERFIRKTTIEKIHAHHMNAHVYTVNDIARIYKLKQMGVDGVFSDFPERIIKARDLI
jgi:glycerophosphoryl diester phosphodiesterase